MTFARAVLLPAVALIVGAASARALPNPAQTGDAAHTVKWFADNPRERARVELRCIDDPGHLANTPDCINAKQAGAELSYRLMVGDGGPRYRANDPRFWSQRPEVRSGLLNMCRLNKSILNCDAARASLMIDAGLVRR